MESKKTKIEETPLRCFNCGKIIGENELYYSVTENEEFYTKEGKKTLQTIRNTRHSTYCEKCRKLKR
jgi:DNA-directed RNA polymerase subunit N (RpoN/RPB10)